MSDPKSERVRLSRDEVLALREAATVVAGDDWFLEAVERIVAERIEALRCNCCQGRCTCGGKQIGEPDPRFRGGGKS